MIHNKKLFQNIGSLLVKTLPDWQKAIFHLQVEENNSTWTATYFINDLNDVNAMEIPLPISSEFYNNLESLRNTPTFPESTCDLIFYRNGQYEIKSDNSKIPVKRAELSKILQVIDEIKESDLKTINIDELRQSISLISTGYILTSPIIKQGTKLYRGVSWDEKPKNLNQLTYPPKTSVTKLHRAGRQGQPLFYCSTAREAPFYELGVKVGDKLAISHWITIEPLVVNNVGYHTEAFKQLGSKRTCPSWDNTKPHETNHQSNIVISQFFAEEFAKPVPPGQEHLYKLSIAIAELHFKSDMFAGLLYPTIAMRANADNLALKPHIVENYLSLQKVEFISVDEVISPQEFKVKILDFANSITKDGQIEWKGRLPHWILREKGEILHLSVENRKWVARNQLGEIVEPE